MVIKKMIQKITAICKKNSVEIQNSSFRLNRHTSLYTPKTLRRGNTTLQRVNSFCGLQTVFNPYCQIHGCRALGSDSAVEEILKVQISLPLKFFKYCKVFRLFSFLYFRRQLKIIWQIQKVKGDLKRTSRKKNNDGSKDIGKRLQKEPLLIDVLIMHFFC